MVSGKNESAGRRGRPVRPIYLMSRDKADSLYKALVRQMDNREPVASVRAPVAFSGQQQKLLLAKDRNAICVLDRHIMERSRSVVFTIEEMDSYYLLSFCCPLDQDEYDRLVALNYVPHLRDRYYLSTGLGQLGHCVYAYASIRISQFSNMTDLLDTLNLLGKELEKVISHVEQNEW